jgi:hypothetical protein
VPAGAVKHKVRALPNITKGVKSVKVVEGDRKETKILEINRGLWNV